MAIVSVFVLLALFSLVSILLGNEDSRGAADPRENPLLWSMIARR